MTMQKTPFINKTYEQRRDRNEPNFSGSGSVRFRSLEQGNAYGRDSILNEN